MKKSISSILCLLLGASLHSALAQKIILPATNSVPDETVATSSQAVQPPTNAAVPWNQPARTNGSDLYHLDTTMGYRRPLNGDYDWLTLATLSFGKMLNEHIALDAAFSSGVVELKHGSPADVQAHQPFFLELGIVWQYRFTAPEAAWQPYFATGASLLWMSWEYREPVDSPNYGFITRDYLEGADGYAGVGLKVRLRKNLSLFGEVDAGGVGFLSTTYSGEHNNLFTNFGYVGARGGLSLTF
ncbi:MAG: hypothetical protein ABSF60_06840 [Verrucomicrobiota bacterium]